MLQKQKNKITKKKYEKCKKRESLTLIILFSDIALRDAYSHKYIYK